MSGEVREQQLRFEIQHIFVREIGTSCTDEAVQARAFLDSIGFGLEARGNIGAQSENSFFCFKV